MIDTMRTQWPSDMAHVTDEPGWGSLEDVAGDTVEWVKRYARENPTSFALWALGIGFVLGWKLKPW